MTGTFSFRNGRSVRSTLRTHFVENMKAKCRRRNLQLKVFEKVFFFKNKKHQQEKIGKFSENTCSRDWFSPWKSFALNDPKINLRPFFYFIFAVITTEKQLAKFKYGGYLNKIVNDLIHRSIDRSIDWLKNNWMIHRRLHTRRNININLRFTERGGEEGGYEEGEKSHSKCRESIESFSHNFLEFFISRILQIGSDSFISRMIGSFI